ncbi:MAG: carbohydrate kinase family protein [bacterium]|nr:carbohydrate kinase family protein [bacterium]
MNILIFGHVCIDQNKSENSEYVYWGSPAMFMNKVFGKFPDNSVAIVSNYGHDFVEYLKDVDIHPPKAVSKKTLVYQNVTRKEQRSQKALYRELSEPVVMDGKLKERIKDADVIVFAPILPNYDSVHIEEVIRYANKKCLKVLLPQGYFRDFDENHNVIFRDFQEAGTVLKHFDLVTLSEEDYPDIEKLSERWARDLNINIVVTKGKNGAVLITKDGYTPVQTTPIPEEEIVDSVGSGDTFSAALIHEFQKTGDLVEAIKFAHKIAGEALKSTHSIK